LTLTNDKLIKALDYLESGFAREILSHIDYILYCPLKDQKGFITNITADQLKSAKSYVQKAKSVLNKKIHIKHNFYWHEMNYNTVIKICQECCKDISVNSSVKNILEHFNFSNILNEIRSYTKINQMKKEYEKIKASESKEIKSQSDKKSSINPNDIFIK
jgi:hypothetical protein